MIRIVRVDGMMTPAGSNAASTADRVPPGEPFTYWREPDGDFLGFLNAYPDHWMQGDDLEDVKDQLLDLYHEF